MKSLLNNSNYSLTNVINYKKNMEENTSLVIEKYFHVLMEFLKYILDNIKTGHFLDSGHGHFPEKY